MSDTQQQLADMGITPATPQPVEPVQPTPQPAEPQPVAPEPTPAVPATEGGETIDRLQARVKFIQTEHQRLLDTLKANNPDLAEQYRQEAMKRRRGIVEQPQPTQPEYNNPDEDYEARIVKLASQGVRQELEQERLRLQIEADAQQGEQLWNAYVQQASPSQETVQAAAEYVRRYYGIDYYAPGGPQRWVRAVADVIDKTELTGHIAQQATQAAAQAAAKAAAIATVAIPDGQPTPAPDNKPKTPAQKELERMGLWNTNTRTP